MLVSEGNHLTRFRYGYSHSGLGVGAKLDAGSAESVQIAAVRRFRG